jgi:hypothetical protein
MDRKGFQFAGRISLFLVFGMVLPSLQAEIAEPEEWGVQNQPTMRGSEVLRVGSGTGCDFPTIQQAINAANPALDRTMIRINQGTYVEALSVTNKSVTLVGGALSCTDSGPIFTNHSTIVAPAGSRPLTFSVNSGNESMSLFSLNIVQGNLSAMETGGGILAVASGSGRLDIILNDTFVESNNAGAGGGVAVQTLQATASVELHVQQGTVIGLNDAAVDGGGIWCGGPGTNRVLISSSTVRNNRAGVVGGDNARGGGIYLDSCELDWAVASSFWQLDELHNNTSYGRGGGIFARNGSDIILQGFRVNAEDQTISYHPIVVRNNAATGPGGDPGAGQGGGIWLDGSQLTATGIWIDSNSTTGNGGGIYAIGGSQVRVNRDIVNSAELQGQCHTTLECSRITRNRADDTGGAVYLRDSGTQVDIDGTVVRDNSALAGAGATLFAQTQSNLVVRNSLIHGGNPPSGAPNYIFWVGTNAIVSVFWSTVAGNSPGTAVFRFGATSSLLRLRGSIIHEPGVAMGMNSGSNTPTVDSECVVWHSNVLMNPPYLFQGGANFHAVANPQFTDAAAHDYRLTINSLAVDFCDASSFPGTAPPIDLVRRQRGIQVKETPLHGPFDLGAFEFLPDRIFADRFEGP